MQWHETSYYRFFHAFLVAIAAFGSGHFSVLLLHVKDGEKAKWRGASSAHIPCRRTLLEEFHPHGDTSASPAEHQDTQPISINGNFHLLQV